MHKTDKPSASPFKDAECQVALDTGLITLRITDTKGAIFALELRPADVTGLIGTILAAAGGDRANAVPGKPASTFGGLRPTYFGYGQGKSPYESRVKAQFGQIALAISVSNEDLIELSRTALQRQSQGGLPSKPQ